MSTALSQSPLTPVSLGSYTVDLRIQWCIMSLFVDNFILALGRRYTNEAFDHTSDFMALACSSRRPNG